MKRPGNGRSRPLSPRSLPGAERLRAPRPPARWTGMREATRPAPTCPQFSPFGLADPQAVSEDCPYLDVHRPGAARPGAHLPVILRMHGGAYGQGAGTQFGGRTMAELTGSVVVGINHRLGQLGCLALPELARENGLPSGRLRGRSGERHDLRPVRGQRLRLRSAGRPAPPRPGRGGRLPARRVRRGPGRGRPYAARAGPGLQVTDCWRRRPRRPSGAERGTVPVLIGSTLSEARLFAALAQPRLTAEEYAAHGSPYLALSAPMTGLDLRLPHRVDRAGRAAADGRGRRYRWRHRAHPRPVDDAHDHAVRCRPPGHLLAGPASPAALARAPSGVHTYRILVSGGGPDGPAHSHR